MHGSQHVFAQKNNSKNCSKLIFQNMHHEEKHNLRLIYKMHNYPNCLYCLLEAIEKMNLLEFETVTFVHSFHSNL